MDAQEFRSKLRAFLGEDEYRKLIVYFREKQRMRFYHEKQLAKFINANPQFSLSPSELQVALRVCEIHGDELQWGEANVFQERMDRVQNFMRSRGQLFPHCGTVIVVQEALAIQLMSTQLWLCPTCRKASEEWENPRTRGYSFPNLRAQSYPISGVPADELRAALEVVLNSPEVRDKRIMSVRWHPEGYIELRTGIFRGAMNGGGYSVTLRQRRGTWVIDEIGGWSS